MRKLHNSLDWTDLKCLTSFVAGVSARFRSSRPWVRSLNGRAPDSKSEGGGSSPSAPARDGVAQLAERVPVKHEDAGSIPATVAMCPWRSLEDAPSSKEGTSVGSTPTGHTTCAGSRREQAVRSGRTAGESPLRVRISPRVQDGPVAQQVERRVEGAGVGGSIPSRSTRCASSRTVQAAG